MAWYIKTSLFYYQNACDFSRYQPHYKACLYVVVVRLLAVFSALTP